MVIRAEVIDTHFHHRSWCMPGYIFSNKLKNFYFSLTFIQYRPLHVSFLNFLSSQRPLTRPVVRHHHHHHHHHHVHEGLGVFPVPWSPRWSWSLHLFLGRPLFLRPFGLYCSVCFVILFVSILCKCCSHFSWYCLISFICSLFPFFP